MDNLSKKWCETRSLFPTPTTTCACLEEDLYSAGSVRPFFTSQGNLNVNLVRMDCQILTGVTMNNTICSHNMEQPTEVRVEAQLTNNNNLKLHRVRDDNALPLIFVKPAEISRSAVHKITAVGTSLREMYGLLILIICVYFWFVSMVILNKLMHSLNGNMDFRVMCRYGLERYLQCVWNMLEDFALFGVTAEEFLTQMGLVRAVRTLTGSPFYLYLARTCCLAILFRSMRQVVCWVVSKARILSPYLTIPLDFLVNCIGLYFCTSPRFHLFVFRQRQLIGGFHKHKKQVCDKSRITNSDPTFSKIINKLDVKLSETDPSSWYAVKLRDKRRDVIKNEVKFHQTKKVKNPIGGFRFSFFSNDKWIYVVSTGQKKDVFPHVQEIRSKILELKSDQEYYAHTYTTNNVVCDLDDKVSNLEVVFNNSDLHMRAFSNKYSFMRIHQVKIGGFDYVLNNGSKLHGVAPDGNCFFRSISVALSGSTNFEPIQKQVIERLPYFNKFIQDSELSSYKSVIDRWIKTKTCYLLDLSYVAKCLNITINVYRIKDNFVINSQRFFSSSRNNNAIDILHSVLIDQHGEFCEHFDPFVHTSIKTVAPEIDISSGCSFQNGDELLLYKYTCLKPDYTYDNSTVVTYPQPLKPVLTEKANNENEVLRDQINSLPPSKVPKTTQDVEGISTSQTSPASSAQKVLSEASGTEDGSKQKQTSPVVAAQKVLSASSSSGDEKIKKQTPPDRKSVV